jgi:hypothetical protein
MPRRPHCPSRTRSCVSISLSPASWTFAAGIAERPLVPANPVRSIQGSRERRSDQPRANEKRALERRIPVYGLVRTSPSERGPTVH